MAFYPQKSMKMQLLNMCSEVLNKFISILFSKKKKLLKRLLLTVTQFYISSTSNGGVSGEICKSLEEYCCWVATSEIDCHISWKICIKMCYLYIKCAIYYNIIYILCINVLTNSFFYLQTYFWKCLNLTPCVAKKNHMWNYTLIFFFCKFIIDFF